MGLIILDKPKMSLPSTQLSASLEDYLEAIYILSRSGKAARSKDIAEHLQVARSSVTGALRLLADKRMVHYKPYGYITLTDHGRQLAGRIVGRHKVLDAFFCEVLGIEPDTAQEAACLAEHAIGSQIAGRLRLYLEFLDAQKQAGCDVSSAFRDYCRRAEDG